MHGQAPDISQQARLSTHSGTGGRRVAHTAPRSRRAEPGGEYVIQKHAARALHYDLRLELDGVFKSWAVPKGPGLVPGEKHLAVRVEDHPLEYGGFEGVIPKGEYGGGTVMIWDRGRWRQTDGDLESGKLEFVLDGEKLQRRVGARADGRRAQCRRQELAADQATRRHLPVEEPSDLSVATGRSMRRSLARAIGPGRAKARRSRRRRPGPKQSFRRAPDGSVRRKTAGRVRTAARDAGRGAADRRNVAARNQVRRLSHRRSPLARQSEPVQPQR